VFEIMSLYYRTLERSAEVSGFMTLEEVYMMSGGHWFTYTP